MVRFSRQPAHSPTILEHIRAHLDPSGCGLLPGGTDLPDQDVGDNEIRWAPGAADGVGRFYERIRPHTTLSYAGSLLDAIRRSALPPAGVHELGRRLATEGRHVEPVKLGIALLGLSPAAKTAISC